MVKYFFCILFFLPLLSKGQAWEFSSPEKLGRGVNTEYEEAMPLLSPDGKTLYFTRVLYPLNTGGKFTGSDVWVSQYDASTDTWSNAVNPEGFNDKGNSAVIGISANGQVLYFLNTTSSKKADGIYFSKKSNNRWSKPEFMALPGIETSAFFGVYVSPDFDVIFLSMKASDTKGEEDLYVSVKGPSGTWSSPKNLGASINTSGFEIAPFLSADKRRLYFSSNGHKGLGDADIFYSERLYNSWETWSSPRNLGEVLNSKNFDAYFSIYGDSIAFFSSNRTGKYADIYSIGVQPGNEVLSFGQQYLTADQTTGVLGGAKVSRRVSFESSATQLTAPQRELLFYIAEKLNNNRDISIQLLIVEENRPELTEERLNAVADLLKSAGVDGSRLLLTNNTKLKKKENTKTTVEILLFR